MGQRLVIARQAQMTVFLKRCRLNVVSVLSSIGRRVRRGPFVCVGGWGFSGAG